MVSEFTRKIIVFLEEEAKNSASEEERNNRDEIIDYFRNSDGQCNGLAILQAYGRRIADKDEIEEEITNPKDDINFFNQTKEKLLNWNENLDSLNEQDHKDIDRLISNILLYQRFDMEINKDVFGYFKTQEPSFDLVAGEPILQDTKRGNLLKSFDTELNSKSSKLVTKNMMRRILQDVVKPRSIVMIYSQSDNDGGHTNAIYQDNNGRIFLANNEFEFESQNFDGLTDKFWDVTNPQNFRRSGMSISDPYFRKIAGIQVFRFKNDPQYDYQVNLEVTKDDVKDFSSICPNLVGFLNINSVFHNFFNSISKDDAHKLFQDNNLKDEDLKSALLSRSNVLFPNSHKPILAVPPMLMTKEMLLERLQKLDDEKVGAITMTYELDNGYRNKLSILRGIYNEDGKPLTLFMKESGPMFGDEIKDFVDEIWQHSNPSKFRGGFKSFFSDLYFRKMAFYVFDEEKNKDALKLGLSKNDFKPQLDELENFTKETSPSFLNKFPQFANQFDDCNDSQQKTSENEEFKSDSKSDNNEEKQNDVPKCAAKISSVNNLFGKKEVSVDLS